MKRARGFTLVEILIAVTVLGVLTALASITYFRHRENAIRAEALINMDAIRRAELLEHEATGTYANAGDTAAINGQFGLGITEHHYSYSVVDATDNDFRIVAQRLGSLGDEGLPVLLAMAPSGEIFGAPVPPAVPEAPGVRPTTSGGGSAGGVSSGGGGGSGMPSGQTGGGGATGRTGGGSVSGAAGNVPGAGGDRPLVYIPRGLDVWDNWPDENEINVDGPVGEASLLEAFTLIQNESSTSATTADLFRKAVSISFGAAALFLEDAPCEFAYACFVPSPLSVPPDTPAPLPQILFNPDYVDEEPEALAAILVHEGTHLQQYLDATLFDDELDVIDIEFTAFWNSAVYWKEVRAEQLPADTDLEEDLEFIYQTALLGEAAMRALIDARYP